jgi:hypothetical protein
LSFLKLRCLSHQTASYVCKVAGSRSFEPP